MCDTSEPYGSVYEISFKALGGGGVTIQLILKLSIPRILLHQTHLQYSSQTHIHI